MINHTAELQRILPTMEGGGGGPSLKLGCSKRKVLEARMKQNISKTGK